MNSNRCRSFHSAEFDLFPTLESVIKFLGYKITLIIICREVRFNLQSLAYTANRGQRP